MNPQESNVQVIMPGDTADGQPVVTLDGEQIKIESIREVLQAGPRLGLPVEQVRGPKKYPRGAPQVQQKRLTTPLLQSLMARSDVCSRVVDGREWEQLREQINVFGENQIRMHDAITTMKNIGSATEGFQHSETFLNAAQLFDDSVLKTAPIFNELLDAAEKHTGIVKLEDEGDYLNLADRVLTQIVEQSTIYGPIDGAVRDEMGRLKTFAQSQAQDPNVITDVNVREIPNDTSAS